MSTELETSYGGVVVRGERDRLVEHGPAHVVQIDQPVGSVLESLRCLVPRPVPGFGLVDSSCLEINAAELVGDVGCTRVVRLCNPAIEDFTEAGRGLLDVAGKGPGDAQHSHRLVAVTFGRQLKRPCKVVPRLLVAAGQIEGPAESVVGVEVIGILGKDALVEANCILVASVQVELSGFVDESLEIGRRRRLGRAAGRDEDEGKDNHARELHGLS